MKRYKYLLVVGLLSVAGCVTKHPQNLTPIPANPELELVFKSMRAVRPMLNPVRRLNVNVLPQCLWNGNASVTLAWCPSSDPIVTGYTVYWGQGSSSNWVASVYNPTNPCTPPLIPGTNFCRCYGNTNEVGSTNTFVLTNLPPGIMCSFAVTAHDFQMIQSDFSEELEYTPPMYRTLTNDLPLTIVNTLTNIVTLKAKVHPSNKLTVLATTNLISKWSVLTTNAVADTNGNVAYTDTTVNVPVRFYRMLLPNAFPSPTNAFSVAMTSVRINDAFVTTQACPNNNILVLYGVSKTNWNILTTNVVADAYGNVAFHDITTNMTHTYRMKVQP